MNKKFIVLLILLFTCCICFISCNNEASTHDNGKASNIVLSINSTHISLAQARYFAYNKQASYEVFYLASGNSIEWDKPYYEDSDITLEQLVKTEILEDIKKNIIISLYAREKGIQLTPSDTDSIQVMAKTYLADSKGELIAKIDISESELSDIYTMQKLCEKLYEKLGITEDTSAQNTLFNKLSADYDYKLNNDLWNEITFKINIYSPGEVDVVR